MPRGFQNQPCAYCRSGLSTATGDHVFARNFFSEAKRGNLPKVPACVPCNHKKSTLEHYLASVLPFGGHHADAHEALSRVGGRLARNVRLHRELTEGAQGGVIPFRGEAMTNVMSFVVRGLLCYHWNVRLGDEHGVRVIHPTRAAEEAFELYIRGNPRRRVDENLGNGTVRYVGLQIADYDQLSLWKIWMYGGVQLSSGQADEADSAGCVIALTAREEFLARPAITAIFG